MRSVSIRLPLILIASACGGDQACLEYPTWISHVLVETERGRVEVAGLAGGDPIACDQDPGSNGFVLQYDESGLEASTAAVSATFIQEHGWYYELLPLPDGWSTSMLSLRNAKSGQYRVDVWHPDTSVIVQIDSVFSPSHDLQIRFLDADGAVLAEALME